MDFKKTQRFFIFWLARAWGSPISVINNVRCPEQKKSPQTDLYFNKILTISLVSNERERGKRGERERERERGREKERERELEGEREREEERNPVRIMDNI